MGGFVKNSVLERFCAHFESLTGLRICIYDFGYFSMENDRLGVPYERRTHCSDYCALVKTSPEAQACCIKTETWRAQQAEKSEKAFVHRCHAGVSDLIVPIKLGTRLVGAIFIGQVAGGGAERTECARRIARTYGLSGPELLARMRRLPLKSAEELKGFGDVSRFMADYIRQALGSAVTESLINANLVHDERGRIEMARVPNFFLDQISLGEGVIRNALGLVRASYWKEISQRAVAAEVGLSESHFSRLFKRTTGMTFRRCLVEARLSAAAWLTKKTDLKIKEIADLLAYRDASSLQRALRIHSGVTPTELRRRQPMPWHMNQPGLMPK